MDPQPGPSSGFYSKPLINGHGFNAAMLSTPYPAQPQTVLAPQPMMDLSANDMFAPYPQPPPAAVPMAWDASKTGTLPSSNSSEIHPEPAQPQHHEEEGEGGGKRRRVQRACDVSLTSVFF